MSEEKLSEDVLKEAAEKSKKNGLAEGVQQEKNKTNFLKQLMDFIKSMLGLNSGGSRGPGRAQPSLESIRAELDNKHNIAIDNGDLMEALIFESQSLVIQEIQEALTNGAEPSDAIALSGRAQDVMNEKIKTLIKSDKYEDLRIDYMIHEKGNMAKIRKGVHASLGEIIPNSFGEHKNLLGAVLMEACDLAMGYAVDPENGPKILNPNLSGESNYETSNKKDILDTNKAFDEISLALMEEGKNKKSNGDQYGFLAAHFIKNTIEAANSRYRLLEMEKSEEMVGVKAKYPSMEEIMSHSIDITIDNENLYSFSTGTDSDGTTMKTLNDSNGEAEKAFSDMAEKVSKMIVDSEIVGGNMKKELLNHINKSLKATNFGTEATKNRPHYKYNAIDIIHVKKDPEKEVFMEMS